MVDRRVSGFNGAFFLLRWPRGVNSTLHLRSLWCTVRLLRFTAVVAFSKALVVEEWRMKGTRAMDEIEEEIVCKAK